MNARQSLYIQGMHGAIVVVVVIAATLLAYAGKIDSDTVAVLLGAGIAFAGSSGASIGALGQAVNGKSTVSNAQMADREATLRTAMVAAAASEPHAIEETEPEPPGREG